MPQAWYQAPAESLKYNGVAERALALINGTALAARIQAPVLHPGAPAYPSMWAEAVSWACHVLNRAATTENSGEVLIRDVIWFASPPRGVVAVPQASHLQSKER